MTRPNSLATIRPMNNDRISVIDAAKQLGLRKQTAFKMLKRLRIEVAKEKSESHKGQAIAYISQADFKRLEAETLLGRVDDGDDPMFFNDLESGFFYLIQLEPDHDSGRFKLGFAANVAERLRAHRCSAPFAMILGSWPCKRLWERTAIDCVTVGCEQLHTEVFRCDDITTVAARCEQFFGIMPQLNED